MSFSGFLVGRNNFFSQRSIGAWTLDPQASLLPVASIITLNHLKSGCREGPVNNLTAMLHYREMGTLLNSGNCEVTHLDDGAKLGDGDPLPGHGVFGLRGGVALVGAPPG